MNYSRFYTLITLDSFILDRSEFTVISGRVLVWKLALVTDSDLDHKRASMSIVMVAPRNCFQRCRPRTRVQRYVRCFLM